MNRFLKTKAWLMILLSVSIPLFSVSLAAQPVAAVQDAPGVGEDPEVIGVQCEGKADAGQSFIDFMDNGAVKTIEAAAAILFAISAIINLVDTVLDAISLIFGHTDCCWSIIGEAGVCQGLSGVWKAWGNIKGFYPLLIANALGTCACCNGGKPAGDICGSAITMPAGIEIDAFESIYTAVACLCPVAIMFNLRKLKTIYQVHNCCVKQACKAGQSIEACERMLDESTCMYFEGALMKAIVGIVIKLVANFIVSQVKEWLKKNIGEKTMTCFFIFYNAINIPGRIQAVMAAKEWVSDTFSEPDCEALGFEESDNRLGSNSKSDSEAIEAMTNSIASREQRQVTDPKKPTTGGETIVSRAQTKTEGEAINSGSSGSKVVYTPVGEAYQNGRLLNLQPSTDDDFSYTRTDSRTNLPYPGKYYVTSDGVTHYTGGTNDRGTYESQSLPPDAMPGSGPDNQGAGWVPESGSQRGAILRAQSTYLHAQSGGDVSTLNLPKGQFTDGSKYKYTTPEGGTTTQLTITEPDGSTTSYEQVSGTTVDTKPTYYYREVTDGPARTIGDPNSPPTDAAKALYAQEESYNQNQEQVKNVDGELAKIDENKKLIPQESPDVRYNRLSGEIDDYNDDITDRMEDRGIVDPEQWTVVDENHVKYGNRGYQYNEGDQQWEPTKQNADGTWSKDPSGPELTDSQKNEANLIRGDSDIQHSAEQKNLRESERADISNAANEEIAAKKQQQLYDQTAALLASLLGKYAQKYIDDMCKEDWVASVVQNRSSNTHQPAPPDPSSETQLSEECLDIVSNSSLQPYVMEVTATRGADGRYLVNYAIKDCRLTDTLTFFDIVRRDQALNEEVLASDTIAGYPNIRQDSLPNIMIPPHNQLCVVIQSARTCFGEIS